MSHNIYIYILVMAAVTYLIRMLPLALSRKEITSPFVKSFLQRTANPLTFKSPMAFLISSKSYPAKCSG